ncbi:class I SAM-dependent methyltransferase [Candidatus Sumerlaeota bacterium]|nr:class I SAM-dependent methyltransferase [Candidatus Sumerlaeota bacterium]
MANEKQFKLQTQFIATRGVSEYRDTIPFWVNEDDTVLEVGCEWGTTTALIAPHCRTVVGTDVSPECIERARKEYPHIRFEVLDGFDVRAALDFGLDFTKVYVDMSGLSGYRSLLDAISLLQMYATVLRPEAIVMKCGSLKQFASHCFAWHPGLAPRPIRPQRGED